MTKEEHAKEENICIKEYYTKEEFVKANKLLANLPEPVRYMLRPDELWAINVANKALAWMGECTDKGTIIYLITEQLNTLWEIIDETKKSCTRIINAYDHDL